LPVENVIINYTSNNNIVYAGGLTNSTGFTPYVNVMEFNVSNNVRYYFTNYTINATKSGYTNYQASWNLTASKSYNINLTAVAGGDCWSILTGNLLYIPPGCLFNTSALFET
jgi:hypothetical protein